MKAYYGSLRSPRVPGYETVGYETYLSHDVASSGGARGAGAMERPTEQIAAVGEVQCAKRGKVQKGKCQQAMGQKGKSAKGKMPTSNVPKGEKCKRENANKQLAKKGKVQKGKCQQAMGQKGKSAKGKMPTGNGPKREKCKRENANKQWAKRGKVQKGKCQQAMGQKGKSAKGKMPTSNGLKGEKCKRENANKQWTKREKCKRENANKQRAKRGKCSNSVSNLFNSIVGITSANEGEHSAASNSNQRPWELKLKLADAQMLQQWIGQIARKIVVEDGIFAGIYSCGPKINIDAVILTDGLPDERIKKIDKNLLKEIQNSEEKSQFLKLLFSFGAMLSAEIGEQSQQNGTLRALLKAYECVGGKFAKEYDGFSDFVIGAVIKRPNGELKVDKIILEKKLINNLNPSYIHEFDLLNGLNIQMTPKDIINFASFISRYVNVLYYPSNPFEKRFLEKNGLSISTLDMDPVKYRRIAHQLLIHLKNWGLKELKEISKIKLTRRDKCIFGIFTLNLMQRIAKFELLEDYFGELNISDLIERTKESLSYYKQLCAENCYEKSRKELERKQSKQQNKPEKENEGIENSKMYPFFDEAIRIDWNIWKEIIQQIDEITKTVNSKDKDKKQKLEEYFESVEFRDAMQIIRAKFDANEFGLKLNAEVKVKWLDFFTPSKKTTFCSNLAKIRQICVGNIEQYERQMHVIIKQKENHNKFYDFVAIFVKHFGRNSFKNDNEESIEFDLNGAKSFLEKVYNSATNQIEEYECLPNKLNFETVIRAILDQNLNEKAKNLLKEFYVLPKNAEKEGDFKHFLEDYVEVQLFNLLFSFAARLEAIVHGKNIDGTIEESRENSKDKIRAFLAVPNCFNATEWANKFSIFDYWMEIKDLNPNKSQKMPVIGVAIFRKIKENEKAKSISRGNYKMLKSLNEYKFSIYESTKLLRQTYDAIDQFHYTSSYLIIPEIITNLINQIGSEIDFKRANRDYVYTCYVSEITGCEYVKLFQNVSANFMKMQNVPLLMDGLEMIQGWVKMDFEKFCKIIERIDRKVEETKIALLNNVRYDLVIDFKFNAWKDVHDLTEDLLGEWTREKLSKETTFAGGNEKFMIEQINHFTTLNRARELISKIEALKVNKNDGFDLMGLFNELDKFARKFIEEEMANLEKAKKDFIIVKGERQMKETEESKRVLKLAESARKMGKRLGQMLEEMKKHYGQKMNE
ncbi:hypothetical protein GPALN_002088 [Globodera pallida]|nr:hypothetical protein GPALN_002088 [Globodera pallida]